MNRLIEQVIPETVAVPVNTTGAAQNTTWLSVKDFRRLVFLISQGAWAGGTPAVTLQQAQDSSGTNAKTLAFTTMFQKLNSAASWTQNAVASNTFNLPNQANTTTYVEIKDDDLDTNNGFAYVQLQVASPGANADLISIIALCWNQRFGQVPPNVDPKA